MPRRSATTDENNRPPLDKGGLEGGSCQILNYLLRLY